MTIAMLSKINTRIRCLSAQGVIDPPETEYSVRAPKEPIVSTSKMGVHGRRAIEAGTEKLLCSMA